jgi:hypothetical protein
MDRMRLALVFLCSMCRAFNDAMLNSSEPQNKIRKGSDRLEKDLYGCRHRVGVAARAVHSEDGANRGTAIPTWGLVEGNLPF